MKTKTETYYDFLDLLLKRLSGVVSFVALNILLLFFIITFNYEQFVELPKLQLINLPKKRTKVGAVIASIVMAIGVIMFYFKGSFNFDTQAKSLKIYGKIWVFLECRFSDFGFCKNSEYVLNLGLTTKD